MTDDEREIRELVDTWMEASNAGDIATVLDLMTDDALFMTAGGEPFGKEEFRHASESMNGMEMEGRAEIEEIEVLGPWAWARTHIDMTMLPDGDDPISRSGYTLTILRKCADGKWRLYRDANLVG